MYYCNGQNFIKKTLYFQQFYCREPKTRVVGFFNTSFFGSYLLTKNENYSELDTLRYIQSSLILNYCLAYHSLGRRPSQYFIKIEPKLIPIIAEKLDVITNNLRDSQIDIVFNIDVKEFEKTNVIERVRLYEVLYDLHDKGHNFCLANYDWRYSTIENADIITDIFNYIIITPPPSNTYEIKKFIDLCFQIKERYDFGLILGEIKGKTELDIACRTPYYALAGDYIYPKLNIDYININYTRAFI